ncbi:DNA-binding protein, partial [Vibrio parahaemolyticus]|nr:DNA-binding protein [Vibrio parahaemolyticus]
LTSYEVMARYHISYTTLWRRIKDGSLPQPRINRNTRNKLWHIEDLEEYEKKED